MLVREHVNALRAWALRGGGLMEAEDLKRVAAMRTPFAKYKGHLLADLPGA